MDQIVDDVCSCQRCCDGLSCRCSSSVPDRAAERSNTDAPERCNVVRLERSKRERYGVRVVCWMPHVMEGSIWASSAKDAAEQALGFAGENPDLGIADVSARSGFKVQGVYLFQDGPNDVPKDVTEFVPAAYRPNGPKP